MNPPLSTSAPSPQPGVRTFSDAIWWRWAIVLGVAGAILLVGAPEGITPKAWHLFAIFIATIIGSIVRPAPAGAVVLFGVCAIAVTGTMTPAESLRGYADPLVWLVLCAFFISRGVMKTGMGERIAFLFIRALGKRSIGLVYALVGTDTLLASILPSNSARAGGVIFPITRSLAEAYDSRPGPSAKRLGAFLMTAVYQCDVIACAMFLTGQASNVLIARFAFDISGVEMTYAKWFVGGIVPGLASLMLVPLVLFWLAPPEVTHTPHATELARTELRRMGPPSRGEWMMLLVFVVVALLWMTTAWHKINYAVVALLGVCFLLITNVLEWEDVMGERAAWDVFIWYGGLVRMAEALGETGITTRFAEVAAGMTAGWAWGAALAVLLLVYFYAHYAFASITAHATAMFPPFLVVMLAAGAPPQLAVLALAYASNLNASLTHYGTTTAPIYFGAQYVSQREWWRLGLVTSGVTILLWSTLGPLWWKLLGWW
ncbi:MAG: DASS family sodium-coupled anion symporter [Gemmatimonadaceae bacterium]